MTFEQILMIASPIAAGMSAYWGGMLSVRVEMARHDEQIKALAERVKAVEGECRITHRAQ